MNKPNSYTSLSIALTNEWNELKRVKHRARDEIKPVKREYDKKIMMLHMCVSMWVCCSSTSWNTFEKNDHNWFRWIAYVCVYLWWSSLSERKQQQINSFTRFCNGWQERTLTDRVNRRNIKKPDFVYWPRLSNRSAPGLCVFSCHWISVFILVWTATKKQIRTKIKRHSVDAFTMSLHKWKMTSISFFHSFYLQGKLYILLATISKTHPQKMVK